MPKQKNPKFALAFVTGASAGIGAALCRLLARQGIPLLITARHEKPLENIARELREYVPVTTFVGDLGTEEGRNQAVEAIHRHSPDLVINNAGFGLYDEALSYAIQENLDMVDLNIKAVMMLTLEAAKMWIDDAKKGTILNVSSASDLIIFPGFAVYAGTKAFVTQFSQSLDVEVKPHGVRVLVTCPGVVKTDFRKRAAGRDDVRSGAQSMDVNFAAKEIWQQIEKGKGIRYFDFKTRVMHFLARYILPRRAVASLLFNTVKSYKRGNP